MKDSIANRFDEASDSLVIQHSDLSLKSISEMVESGAIDINPKYQRRKRWTDEKESGLIESFLLNIPVPPIYLAEDDKGTYSVIDGKQRITAIHRYFNGELRLRDLEHFSLLEQTRYKDLPSEVANALNIRPYLRVVTLLRQSDPELKHEVFIRLNKAGVPLNSQEIRNVAFRGLLNDLLIELSETPYLSRQLKATPTSKTYREMIDVQYVLRFFTLKQYWKSFPGNMDVAMDQFMAEHYRANSDRVKSMRKDFLRALDACKQIWGDQGFRKPGGTQRVLQGFFDIQMVCISLLSKSKLEGVIKAKSEVKNALRREIRVDDDFAHSLTQFTSNPRNVEYRIGRFLEILKGA